MFKNVTQEAVARVSDNTKFALPGQFVALIGVLYILQDKISQELILLGFLSHLFLILSRLFIKSKFHDNKSKFLSLYFITIALSGIAWGSVLFFIPEVSPEYHILIFAIFIGLISGALFTLGEVIQLYLAYTIPILLISIVWFFVMGQEEIYLFVSYLGLFSFLFYLSAARKYNNNFTEALVEKQEKELLVEELKDKSNIFELLFEHSVMGALIMENGRFIQCNQKSVEMVGCSNKEELLNISPSDISPQYQADGRLSNEKAAEMIAIALEKGTNHFEWLHKRVDGKLFLADVNLSSIILNGKKVLYVSWRDITEEKKLKNDLNHLAHHDTLTNLPNRMLFDDRLEQSIKKAQRGESTLAVLFIDLDKFKPINDKHGHDVGDKVLIKVACLLKKAIRNEDTLARIGGDEFTITLENINNDSDLCQIAQKLLDALSEPIMIDGNRFSLGLSIGISLYPDDAKDAKKLLKLADMAMYVAKDSGRNNYKLYKDIEVK